MVYGDASAHTLVNGLDAKTFLGIVTRDGSEKLDEKTIRPDPIKGKNGPEGTASSGAGPGKVSDLELEPLLHSRVEVVGSVWF